MEDKTNARTEANGAGANAIRDGEMMHKDNELPDFPKKKPDNPDLNAPATSENGREPKGNGGTASKKATKIWEVQRFLESQYKFRYNTVKNAVPPGS